MSENSNISQRLVAAVLTECVKDLSPQGKYFLAGFLLEYGYGQAYASVKELASAFGVTDRVVTRATEVLETANILHKSRPLRKFGSTKFTYRLEPKWLDRLMTSPRATLSGATLRVWPIIKHLLAHRKVDGNAQSEGVSVLALSTSNKAFLSVLLVLSDSGGVVRGVGSSELAKMVGMKKERIRSQATKLEELSYIQGIVHGVSGQTLFGRAAGAYFLNLRHPTYGLLALPGYTVRFLRGDLLGEVFREADVFFRFLDETRIDKRAFISARSMAMDQTVGLQASFSGIFGTAFNVNTVGSQGLAQYLQMKLEEYASDQLDLSLYEIESKFSKYDTALLKRIQIDISSHNGRCKNISRSHLLYNFRHNTFVEKAIEELRDFEWVEVTIYIISLRIAQAVRRLLDDNKSQLGYAASALDYVLLPMKNDDANEFVLDIFLKNNIERCYALGAKTITIDQKLE